MSKVTFYCIDSINTCFLRNREIQNFTFVCFKAILHHLFISVANSINSHSNHIFSVETIDIVPVDKRYTIIIF